MKVAFLGNMNNNHFAMVRFLRDRGVDAELLLYAGEIDHFHPSADTFALDYMSYTRQLAWGTSAQFNATSSRRVREDLKGYDILVGCGLAPAYCHKAGIALDIFKPYGDDIWGETFYRIVTPHLLPRVWRAAHAQRVGIAAARVVHMSKTNRLFEERLQQMRGSGERWFCGLPMVYTQQYSPDFLDRHAAKTHWAHEFAQIRRTHDLMILYSGRHCWGGSAEDPNQKGVDRLFEGFAQFRTRFPDVRAALVTLEYGPNVTQSKERIAALELENAVFWLPRMLRKDLMVGAAMADVVCAEFEHSWIASGILYEALAMAKPILAYRDDALYPSEYTELYPILNARSAAEIALRLEQFIADPEQCVRMGEVGREWYEEHVVEEAIGRYLRFFASGRSLGRQPQDG